ncbi:mitochondrial phosphate carrier protein [Rhizina undulata]
MQGAGALLTGFGPTCAGYFLQGTFKFGGYEFLKQQSINYLGLETASNNRTTPLEATSLRLVSKPDFASGLVGRFGKILRTEGFGAFYSGFGPIKQVPYTIAKFVVSEATQTAVNLGSGLIAGFATAIVSRPGCSSSK